MLSSRPVGTARIAAVALVLLTGACSGRSSDTRAATTTTTTTVPRPSSTTSTVPPVITGAYVDTLADSLASGASGGFPLEADAARCLAPRWVDILGEDRLVEAEVTPEQLASGYGADTSVALGTLIDDEAAEAMVEAFASCEVDVERMFVRALAAGRDLPEEQQTCLVEALPDGLVERALILGLSEGAAALEADIGVNDELTAAAQECVG